MASRFLPDRMASALKCSASAPEFQREYESDIIRGRGVTPVTVFLTVRVSAG